MPHQDLNAFLEKVEIMLFKEEEKSAEKSQQGIIQSFKDGVIHIKGLENLKMSEVVEVEGGSAQALVMNLEKNSAYALVIRAKGRIREGMFVKSHNKFLTIKVSDEIIGRVVDPLGDPLDGDSPVKGKEDFALEKIAPGVMARRSVHQPVQTGIVAIDSLIPIGRGQRELIIGDRQTGKTAIAIDTILNQKDQNMICIYVAVAQREAKTAQVIRTLRENGAMNYSIVVSSPASSSAALQFLAPYAGSAIAEYFLSQGKDVLIIYDDLSKHAVAYREMSLLLRRPPGREAFPGDVFYIHSRLLERACKLNEEHGGGSITALPIIETQAADVSAYIPTNVISITDGQIFLESTLFNKGIRPAINVGISVSRVGGAAQTKIMKKVSGTVKLDLAQYYELEAFSQFASELDEATKAKLTRGRAVVEALKQKQFAPYRLWQEVTLLQAATLGYLDKTDAKEIQNKLQEFLAVVESRNPELVKKIETQKELTEEIAKMIKKELDHFFK